ncbi:MAG: DUF4238 domain-containing protein [Lachnospiraceae bacterium]|nr:DUF4238 domain-containing protein [Lachnospiraceae bacterium]
MPKGSEFTEDEHYVPRMYLREFSYIRTKGKKENAFIWQFNLETMKQSDTSVNVKSICFKKNLYELRDKTGEFIARNIIEKTFSRIENEASTVIRSIKEKSQNEKCLNCPTILSDEDKSILIIFMTALQFRDPNTIQMGIESLQQTNPDMTLNDMRNFTLLNLLPISDIPEWNENTIIRSATDRLCGMFFQIGIAPNDVIISSDRPVIMWPPKENEQFNRPRAIVFPLTSRLVLYLFPMEDRKYIGNDWFTYLSDDQVKEIQMYVAAGARDWIYSKEPLSKEQIELIKKARQKSC